ncbi:class F sortase [Xylanimonas allomyrinae]|uniref:Class F sortase n=1 Tax=Xylanimonas allomyrinae TaxID=2509459 RepID=A0A4P6EME4_9MICO|nr:class F sortase [Xylanimonas allomyrinae]QAY63884.1 class F sortase [Xylanimonas allomyrinae]
MVVALVVVVVALAGVVVVRSAGHGTPVAVPTAAPSRSPAPVPDATYAPPPGTVIAAAPTHVSVPVLGLDAVVQPYTVADAEQGRNALTGTGCYADGRITCIDPPTMGDVYWMQGGVGGVAFGDAPGTQSQANVYLFGHATDDGSGIFTRLYELQAGASVEVSNPHGRLTYEVDQVVTVDKGDYTSLPLAVDQEPGKLLLVTCNHAPGAAARNGSATENVVVAAHLVSSHPA